MNKNLIRKNIIIFVTAISLLVLNGCETLLPEDQFHEIHIPQEKFQEIEPLELLPDEPKEPESEPADLHEPPAEMTLTLEECRLAALQNNLALKAELIAPSIAEAVLLAEEAKFEAAFFSTLRFYRSDQPGGIITKIPDTSTYVTSIDSSQRTDTNLDLGVQVPLQTGGTVTFDLADSRSKTLQANSDLSPWYAEDFQVSISQPLLRDAGRRANLHSIRIAQYEKQIQNNATKLEVISVLAASDRAYWRLYAARKELEVRKQQHDLAVAQLDRAKRFVDAGEMAQVEILRAEAGVARQLAAIITAENELRDRQREFKKTINKPGLDIDTLTVITPASEPDPMYYSLESDRLIKLAMENRTDLLELELRLAEDLSYIDFARNQALPVVNLDYSYSLNGVGPTRTDSWDMLNDKNYENHYLGLSLWVPLGNEERKNDLRRAILTRRQRLATKESQHQLIKQEVLNAIDQVQTNWQQILATRQSAILEGRLYQTEIRQFELGLRTSTDVLEAQTNFADAQSAEIAALIEYQISLVDLAYATGTLLGAAKTEWQPLNPHVSP